MDWFSDFLKNFNSVSEAAESFSLLAFVGRSIWLARIEWTFNGVKPISFKVFVSATRLCLEYREVAKLGGVQSSNAMESRPLIAPSVWSPPDQNLLKINCDVVFSSLGAAIACVVKDSSGSRLFWEAYCCSIYGVC